jgi:hypothetical protein
MKSGEVTISRITDDLDEKAQGREIHVGKCEKLMRLARNPITEADSR